MPQVGEIQDRLSVLDSPPWIPDSRYWILVFVNAWNLDSSFQSLVGFEIPLELYLDSKSLDSGFHKQKISLVRNPDYLSWSEKSVDSPHFYP